MNFKTKVNYFWMFPKFFFIAVLVLLDAGLFYAVIASLLSSGDSEGLAILIPLAIFIPITYYMIRSLLTKTMSLALTDAGIELHFPFIGHIDKYPYEKISRFYTSNEYNKQQSFAQVLIYFKEGEKLKLSEEKVKNYNEMVAALKTSPIKYAGYREQGLMDFG
jgi:hypothetical protein